MNHDHTCPRWLRIWVLIVTASAFGPYVIGSVRTEQLVVYGSAAVAGVLATNPAVQRKSSASGSIVLLLAALLLTVAISGIFPPDFDFVRRSLGASLAGIDNALMPLALVILCLYWQSFEQTSCLLRVVTRTIVAAMLCNAGLAVMSVAGLEMTWLARFWGTDPGSSVALNAEQNGRFSGLFNQPAEAGIAYSVGLVSLAYLLRTRDSKTFRRSWPLSVMATVIVVGGVLTTSKIFLLGGVPIFLYMTMRAGQRSARFIGATGLSGLAVYAIWSTGVLPNWSGVDMLEYLFSGVDSPVDTLTAGRLGADGTLESVVETVLHEAPLFGFGAGGISVAYDSAWVEALVMGGIVSVVVLAGVFLSLVNTWWRKRGVLSVEESALAGAVIGLVAGASIGVPSLTANRAGTLVWLILGLLIVTTSRRSTAVVSTYPRVLFHRA